MGVPTSGIAFFLALIILINIDLSFAQGMSRWEACGYLCGMQDGYGFGDPMFRNPDPGFGSYVWGNKKCRRANCIKIGRPRPPPTAGGCNNYGQSCWGGIGKRKR